MTCELMVAEGLVSLTVTIFLAGNVLNCTLNISFDGDLVDDGTKVLSCIVTGEELAIVTCGSGLSSY